LPPPLFSSTRFLFSSQQYHGSYLGLTHTSHQYLASTQSDHWVIPRISGHRERERKKVHYLQSIPPWAVTRYVVGNLFLARLSPFFPSPKSSVTIFVSQPKINSLASSFSLFSPLPDTNHRSPRHLNDRPLLRQLLSIVLLFSAFSACKILLVDAINHKDDEVRSQQLPPRPHHPAKTGLDK